MLLCHTDDQSRVCLNEIPDVEGSDYINASFIDVRKPGVFLLHIYMYDMVLRFSRDTVARKGHILQPKVCYIFIKLPPSGTHSLFFSSTRASERVRGAILEDGVGIPDT